MSESVNLPALGESVTEGTVTRWLKNVGDSVEVDEPLLEVSTDKVDTEIPSPIAGVIEEILVAEDETVEVGTALVRIGDGSAGGAPSDDAAGGTADDADAAAPSSDADAAAPAGDADESAPSSGDGAQAQPAPSEAAPAEAAPAEAAPAEAAQAEAAPAEPAQDETPAEADDDTPGAEDSAASGGERPIEEVPSNDAPAPGEDGAAAPSAPDPADAVDAPPAAAAAPAAPAPAAPAAPAPAAAATTAAPAPAAPATPVASSAPVPSVPNADAAGSAGGSNAGYVTPLVRKLAHEKGVDLAAVTGTGVGGRIRKEDVLAAVAPSAPASGTPASSAAATTAEAPKPLETSPLRGTTVPMSRLRKVISERAVQSMQASAQLTSVVEVDVTRVAELRSSVKETFLEKTGTKLSFLPFFALAASEALKAYPIVNATIDTESNSIVYPDHENLSIAVDTERGLLTPVIRNAADLDLAGFSQQIADLAARTRDNKLKPDELAGGTFTLTNTGSRGALFDTPLVFLPQSAILGTGIVAKKPVVISQGGTDAIAIRSMVYLALSYDHRIVDGADAARFLVAVKNRLEDGQFQANLGI